MIPSNMPLRFQHFVVLHLRYRCALSPKTYSRRLMSSKAKQLQKFFVYAPDSLEEGTLARRYEVRPRHMEGVAPLIKAGIIRG